MYSVTCSDHFIKGEFYSHLALSTEWVIYKWRLTKVGLRYCKIQGLNLLALWFRRGKSVKPGPHIWSLSTRISSSGSELYNTTGLSISWKNERDKATKLTKGKPASFYSHVEKICLIKTINQKTALGSSQKKSQNQFNSFLKTTKKGSVRENSIVPHIAQNPP